MGIPSYLWACLISSNLNRDKSLRTLRKIAENSIDNHDDELNMFLCHQWIGMNNSDLFTKIFEFIKDDDEIKKVLSPLCYFENMPGHDRWLSLGLKPNEDSSKYLINTVRMCYDHQSIESTDVRWFFVLTMAAYGKIVFRREDEEFTKQIFYYPNRGDQRSVRPSIRAMENMIRQGLHEQEAALGSSWANYFWRECMEKTECIIKESDTPSAEDHKKTISQALNIADLLSLHYSKNTKESSNNTRVEV